MKLTPDTVVSVQAAWAQILGVPRKSLAENGPRIYREKNDNSVLMFVSLFGTGVVVGPQWALDAARSLTDDQLANPAQLLVISAPHGGQPLGSAGLFFCDSAPYDAAFHDTALHNTAFNNTAFGESQPHLPGPAMTVSSPAMTVSRDCEDAAALQRGCSPDDVAEVGLSDMMNTFVLLGGEGLAPRPLAGSGYDVWAESLAHMGVLTAAGQRRKGHAVTAVSIAVNHAIASSLVPQWRARTNNTASTRTALRAGFHHAGSQTTVILEAA